MGAATPGAIREFHEKVVSERKLNIDLCLGLERKDRKYRETITDNIDRISDTFDRIYVDLPIQDSPRKHWPPDLDYETFRERFFADFSPAPGDADIHYWLDRAAGTVDHPIGNSLHGQILDVFGSLFVATHDPDYSESFSCLEDDPDEFVNAFNACADETLAEIGREHREKLEKITPEMLRAEAEAACRLLEGKQPVDDSGGGREQSVNSQSARAIEALLGEEGEKVLGIAHSDDTADDKMRAICGIDRRCLAWKSPLWADLLHVSEPAIRQTKFWKEDRPKANEALKELREARDD
jgi:hypothetical protein